MWGAYEGNMKIAWVAQKDICKSKRFGGLRVGFLKRKNKRVASQMDMEIQKGTEDARPRIK